MQTKVTSIQEMIKSRVNAIFKNLNERKGHTTPAFDFEDECNEEEDEADMSTVFLQIMKKIIFGLARTRVISSHYLCLDSTVESTI